MELYEFALWLIGAIVICLLGYKFIRKLTQPNEFDIKIKEIENVLNSSEARSRKYELFDELGKLADNCTNYSNLSKLQKLLGRVYDL